MKKAIQIGYVLSLGLIAIGARTTFASCPEKIDPQLCDILNQVEDTAWVGCLIGLNLQPPDSQITDPTKDTTNHHNTSSPAPYLVAEIDSLFTNFDIRLPDTIFPNRLVYSPQKSRASIPTIISNNYHAFLRKNDILAMGSKEYIGGVDAWFDDGILSVTPFLRDNLDSRNNGSYFNLNGQRRNRPKYLSGPLLKFKE